MTEKNQTRKMIHLIYGVLLSVLIVIVAICLIRSCVEIYKSGASPFTRESIAAQFAEIAVPVYVCLAGIAVGIVLSLVLPLEDKKLRGMTDEKKTLAKLRTRLDIYGVNCDGALRDRLKKEPRLRVLLRIICALLCMGTAVPLIVYLSDLSHFTVDLNASILAATYMALPWVVISGGVCLIEVYLERASVSREIALVKEAIAAGAVSKWEIKDRKTGNRGERVGVAIVRVVLLVAAVALIVMGIDNGGMKDVLGKAIRICTECIGLG